MIDKVQTTRFRGTAIGLTILFGFAGGQKFYLRQYFSGIVMIILAPTFIPLAVSLVELVILIFMKDEVFNRKYNSPPQQCAGCKREINFWVKPVFGNGKLSDGGQLCTNCFGKLIRGNNEMAWNIKKKYTSAQIPEALAASEKKRESDKTIKNRQRAYISDEFFNLMADISNQMYRIVQKINSDKLVTQKIREAMPSSDIKSLISSCVIFDLLSCVRYFKDGQAPADTPEVFAFSFVANRILPNPVAPVVNLNYETIIRQKTIQEIRALAKKLIEAIGTENPVQIKIVKDGNPQSTLNDGNFPEFSLPLWLYVTQSPCFNEYAAVLYRYATMIAKADETETGEETAKLKMIYKAVHHPDGQGSSDSSAICTPNPDETLEMVLDELNSLTGLENVKAEVLSLINFIRMQQERSKAGLKLTDLNYHIVFTGNPGTGKTTVARIVAKIYRHLGILSQGHLVETDRSGLVAEYAGQTAVKVNRTVDSALNGVLFIDEAYSLVGENRDDFGKEAVATLIRRIENDRDKLVVILAGYSGEMQTFIETNPGFKSRFNRYFEFTDYSPAELMTIFESLCRNLDYQPDEEAKASLRKKISDTYHRRDRTFGNGRFIRNIFEKTIERQSNRIAGEKFLTRELLCAIIEKDIPVN